MPNLEEDLKQFLINQHDLEDSEVGYETALFSDGLLDSFAMVDLVAFVEGKAGIRTRAKDLTLENFDSITRIVEFVSDQS